MRDIVVGDLLLVAMSTVEYRPVWSTSCAYIVGTDCLLRPEELSTEVVQVISADALVFEIKSPHGEFRLSDGSTPDNYRYGTWFINQFSALDERQKELFPLYVKFYYPKPIARSSKTRLDNIMKGIKC